MTYWYESCNSTETISREPCEQGHYTSSDTFIQSSQTQWCMLPQTVPKPGTVVNVDNMVTKVLWPSPHSTTLSIMEITQKGSIIQHPVPNIIRTCHKVSKEGEESRPNPMEIMKFPPKEPYPSLISNLSPGWKQQWPNICYYKLYNNTNTNLHTNIYLQASRR